ncbi:uncharacterized protein si:ch211-114l13.9 [Pristis pectinata]|uniref:uncharacterized protein si:ch211-114l13.9 n=1 Tax=Pristis pectinata TaxID=685728 RepID=UPI00223E3B0F|nr:uncharacterized protein si:ch211-114l13.9 [Pristis pectinata]
MTSKHFILEVLDELTARELNRFIFFLNDSTEWKPIPSGRLEDQPREEIALLLQNHYGNQVVDVARKILHDIPRRDLIERMFKDAERDGSIGMTGERKRDRPEGQDSAGTMSDRSENNNPNPKKNKVEAKLLTDKQLMKLASKMGHNGKQIGIQFLKLESYEIDQCESQAPTLIMQNFNILQLWRNREKKNATAKRLHAILASNDCPISSECIDWLLEENQ